MAAIVNQNNFILSYFVLLYLGKKQLLQHSLIKKIQEQQKSIKFPQKIMRKIMREINKSTFTQVK